MHTCIYLSNLLKCEIKITENHKKGDEGMNSNLHLAEQRKLNPNCQWGGYNTKTLAGCHQRTLSQTVGVRSIINIATH